MSNKVLSEGRGLGLGGIELDGNSDPGFEVRRVDSALCDHREHTRITSSRE